MGSLEQAKNRLAFAFTLVFVASMAAPAGAAWAASLKNAKNIEGNWSGEWAWPSVALFPNPAHISINAGNPEAEDPVVSVDFTVTVQGRASRKFKANFYPPHASVALLPAGPGFNVISVDLTAKSGSVTHLSNYAAFWSIKLGGLNLRSAVVTEGRYAVAELPQIGADPAQMTNTFRFLASVTDESGKSLYGDAGDGLCCGLLPNAKVAAIEIPTGKCGDTISASFTFFDEAGNSTERFVSFKTIENPSDGRMLLPVMPANQNNPRTKKLR